MACKNLSQHTGHHLLFIGTESANWQLSDYSSTAQFARHHGVDKILLKVADGGVRWYGGIDGYRQRRHIFRTAGVGVIPYMYSYGNQFNFLDGEIDILIAHLQEDGVVCADMEKEWNGQAAWATHLCQRLQAISGIFLVSTWADPLQQAWDGVVKALNPRVDAYMPQVYTNWLGSQYTTQYIHLGAHCLQPTVDLSQEFGANDPVAITADAHRAGHTAISVWYDGFAKSNPALLDAVFAAFPKR